MIYEDPYSNVKFSAVNQKWIFDVLLNYELGALNLLRLMLVDKRGICVAIHVFQCGRI